MSREEPRSSSAQNHSPTPAAGVGEAAESAAGARPGRITLVGGGPGAADLMTVRARDTLAAADVVLYDRLAPTDDLRAWAPQAQLFDVGKRPGHHRVTQENIHSMMIDAACRGQHVVRFKGGDPFVFGRGCEEVAACRDAGIPVTVVPGLTSAVAVPAAAGIPVTARGINRAFTVISGHDPLTEEELAGLTSLGGTVVVLMGVGTLGHTVEGLRRHGLSDDTPVGVVEKGYSPEQRVCLGLLDEILSATAAQRISSPAVLVIGEVVRLAADGPGRGEARTEEDAAGVVREAALQAGALV
ncbi:uroporphyrinogen-III C-methyltransferase [Nesterenkonia cremea]|uniref:uroporphyrinogen-III C-methyltransferase n=1 Tax=Nesterenkonia cremea TaxID=1882340 RepID=A0A917ER71_9MICC|nr:uroporphyrinogen-III C-methyltransferase [Nesterenkonia cremea]GGE69076.1 hypothetical protein GCM10011401_15580 [Nesterenkonia cremea]